MKTVHARDVDEKDRFGIWFKERLRSVGLSQEDLASRLMRRGLSVWRWTAGRSVPDVRDLLLIFSVLGVCPERVERAELRAAPRWGHRLRRARRLFAEGHKVESVDGGGRAHETDDRD